MRTAFSLSLVFAVCASPVWAAAPSRPNILVIMSDDHGWQAMSCYGDPRKLIETPNMDRIAREGMRFDRCLVTNSLCGPCRATILTGKYSHLNGIYNNANSFFDGSQTTFPKLLQAAGYQTALIGKWHLATDPTGFDHWQILTGHGGQGVYYNPPTKCDGKEVNEVGYTTDVITDRSLEWLQKRDKSRPFLLMCHHKATHGGWEPAVRDLDFDHGRKYDEPDTLFDDLSGRGIAERSHGMLLRGVHIDSMAQKPPSGLSADQAQAWKAYYEPLNQEFRKANPQGAELVRWKYQRLMHDYLGCVKGVDDNVGRLLKFLDDEGLAENTIVVYTSDQGFYLGEHGWFDKRLFFEESLRTPLVIRWPAVIKAGSVSKNIVANLDFAETFLEAAGLPVPTEMQGRSLLPILKGRASGDRRTALYYHYYEFPHPFGVRPHYGVVTDRYKLIHFYGTDVDYWELFDLEKDPHELQSVYSEPQYAAMRKELELELARLRKELRVPDKDQPYVFGGPRPANRRPRALKQKKGG